MIAGPEPWRQTTGSIAQLVGGQLVGSATVPIRGVESLEQAGPQELTFVADAAHARRWARSHAAAALFTQRLVPADLGADGRPLIVVPDAEMALIELLDTLQPQPQWPEIGVHPTAWVHPTATLARSARIGAHVSVDGDAIIGEQAVLFSGVRLYHHTRVGAGSVLHANCVIRERCLIGAHVILHQNVSIGADGFGYRPSKDGRGLVKVAHLGHVVIEDYVEIGAGTCVDRAKFGATVIGEGTKIDNLCQIAHNCRIGRACVIAGLTGIAGSVVIEDGAMIGGHVGIAEHVRVGQGARIGAKSGVMRDVPAGQTVLGIPALPATELLRQQVLLHRLSASRSQDSQARRAPGVPPGPGMPGRFPEPLEPPEPSGSEV